MSDHNEIDDILNEIKSKKEPEDKKDFEIKEEVDNSSISFDFLEVEKSKITSSSEASANNDTNGRPENNKKKIIIIAVVAILVVAIVAGVVFAVTKAKNKEPETTEPTTTTTTETTTEAPALILNPLTGESEYNENAVGKRPVAIVVENAYAARPQWGIDDSTNSPDIILEGEVEGGETRMLWFYADYTSVPDQIGPIRSARPPFIRFSELYDSIFIHWGQSSSRDNYVGADTVFKTDGVDHINQMAYSDKVGLFSRDKSRGVSSEHTGVLHGNKLEQAIENAKFRTDVKESSFTQLAFNEKEQTVGSDKCTAFAFTFSSNTKTRDWKYSEDDKMYHCTDYLTDVARKNLLVLYDTTEYVAKSNYKGSGKSEIYCNYKLAGGSGKLVSLGTITDITWSVQNGVLKVKDSNGNDVSLNPGKTWIGYGSSNKGGKDKNNTPVESTSAQN